MSNLNWLVLPALIWFLSSCLHLGINGQSQSAIGAHRAYQKTSFSCSGRPAGYYADIETGCQVYHMCDGLGRQFSYSCPNTTLFQQRMLICDHWYMVNCSKAESDYAANLLIGQRDKPFVNDEAINLRTPRPDLLDRPYAFDYAGESFRNQYKQSSAPQNKISDTKEQKSLEKATFNNQPQATAQRWKIPPPSRLILPPAYEPQILENETKSSTGSGSNGKPYSTSSSTTTTRRQSSSTRTSTRVSTTSTTMGTTTTTTRRPSTRRIIQQQKQQLGPAQNYQQFNNAALHQRPQEFVPATADHDDDLGTSHSTRYNTSADFNSAEAPSKSYYRPRQPYKTITKTPSATAGTTFRTTPATTKATTIPTTTNAPTTFFTTTTTTQKPIVTVSTKFPLKIPSKIYEPPFLYPIYNLNETLPSTTIQPLRASTAAPFTKPQTTFNDRRFQANTFGTSIPTTTSKPPSRPTTVAGRPFSLNGFGSTPTRSTPITTTTLSSYQGGRNQNNLIQQQQRFESQKFSKETRTPTPAQGFKPPTPRPPVSTTSKTPQRTFSPITAPVSRSEVLTPFSNRFNQPSPFVAPSKLDLKIDLPSNDLLPPLQDFIAHDIATTQGPPIYYEWKIPSNGLEPPKLDPPYGVDGREYPESIINYNKLESDSDKSTDSNNGEAKTDFSSTSSAFKFSFDQQTRFPALNSPFLQKNDSQTLRTPISRSIKDTAQPNNFNSDSSSTAIPAITRRSDVMSKPNADISEIRKEWSVPEFSFPLETIGRTGYLSPESYNSFQLKIPERKGDATKGSIPDDELTNDEGHLHWFGENPKCPECHPSYVVPGTCEPCLRR